MPVVSIPILAVTAFAVLKEYKSLWVVSLAVNACHIFAPPVFAELPTTACVRAQVLLMASGRWTMLMPTNLQDLCRASTLHSLDWQIVFLPPTQLGEVARSFYNLARSVKDKEPKGLTKHE